MSRKEEVGFRVNGEPLSTTQERWEGKRGGAGEGGGKFKLRKSRERKREGGKGGGGGVVAPDSLPPAYSSVCSLAGVTTFGGGRGSRALAQTRKKRLSLHGL